MGTTATERGWSLHPKTVRVPCPGIPLNLRPEVAPLFEELIRRVEAVKGKGWMTSSGGYNPRPVRGYELKFNNTGSETYLSNHAWGLAADFRAGTNGMGTALRTDMPSNISSIANSCGLQWGGDYTGRKDPMHFEFVGTPAEAARAVAALTAKDEEDMTPEQDARMKSIEYQLTNKWPQLGGRTLVDALAAVLTETRGEFDFGAGQPKTTLIGAIGRITRKLGA